MLPFEIEDKRELDTDVAIAIVVFSVLSSDAVVDNDSDGVEIVLTDVSMCVSGDE